MKLKLQHNGTIIEVESDCEYDATNTIEAVLDTLDPSRKIARKAHDEYEKAAKAGLGA